MDTAVDHVLYDKIKGIAYGDYREGIKALETVFVQRKKCAEAMLACDSSNARDYLLLCDEEIKKVLYL